MIHCIGGVVPDVDKAAFIADSADIAGAVSLAEGTSVWYGAVLRAEGRFIQVGRDSNIQDNATLHADAGHVIRLGERVSVGHNAIVHGATIGSDVIVGMHATVLDNAQVGDRCIIGAGAVVPGGMVIPAGSLVLGVPAKVVRPLSEQQLASLAANAEEYVQLAAQYRQNK